MNYMNLMMSLEEHQLTFSDYEDFLNDEDFLTEIPGSIKETTQIILQKLDDFK